MTEGMISDDELAKLFAAEGGDDLFADELFSDEPMPAKPAPPPDEKKQERIMSQAEIDALLASLGN
jgi:hypothetical protein